MATNGPENGKSDKLAVKVDTLAKPVSDALLAARTAIQVRPDLQDLFKQAKAKGWSSGVLADALYVRLGEYVLDTENLWETALYLADEFMQLEEEGQVLLVSRETGQAIYKLAEDDIYTPAPVLRESGEMAQPLPRIRPELEGAIVQWQFGKERERQVEQKLAQRVPQSELLIQEGDNRLLRATQRGRKKIAEMLKQELPKLLPPTTGTISMFFDLFQICEPSEVPDEFEKCGSTKAQATIITPIVDPLTSNLRYDPFTTLKHQIISRWGKGIATHLSNMTLADEPIEASILDALPTGIWVAEPNVAMAFSGKIVMPVEGVKTLLLPSWLAPIACLCIDPDSYDCKSREFLDRWEVAAVCEFTLYMKPDTVTVYNLKDIPESFITAEVVS
jgi:hypothetical protein